MKAMLIPQKNVHIYVVYTTFRVLWIPGDQSLLTLGVKALG